MPFISYQDLQYGREQELHGRIKPAFDHLHGEVTVLRERVNLLERAFYENLDQSVRIDVHPVVATLLGEVQKNLNTDFEIQVFLANSPMPSACVMPRYGQRFGKALRAEKAIILVSGHFFNDLDAIEQKAILGHELGHILFGHTDVPKELVNLDDEDESPELARFLRDLMRWSICCEISCDLVSLVAAGGDSDATATALLKFSSGLNASSFKALGRETLIQLLSNQYDEISHSAHLHQISSHPLVPLRLRVHQAAAAHPLLKRFGSEVSAEEWQNLRCALQTEIDELMRGVYPDLAFFEGSERCRQIAFKLGVAVGMSDGALTRDELNAVFNVCGGAEETYRTLLDWISSKDREEMLRISNLFARDATKVAKETNLKRPDILSVLRMSLIVAAADGHVSLDELRVLSSFSEPYGVTKEEILYLAHQITGAL